MAAHTVRKPGWGSHLDTTSVKGHVREAKSGAFEYGEHQMASQGIRGVTVGRKVKGSEWCTPTIPQITLCTTLHYAVLLCNTLHDYNRTTLTV